MNTIKKTLMGLAVAVGIATVAQATPIVYWNGDLVGSSKKGTWTMTAGSGCSFANGVATTTKSGGGSAYTGLILTPDSGSFTANDMTVVVEYSGLEYGNTSKGGHCFITVKNASDTEYAVGAVPTTQKQVLLASGTGGSYQTKINWNDIPTEGLMAASFVSSSDATKKGIRFYFAGKNSDGTYQPFRLAGYKSCLSSAVTYSSIKIGGSDAAANTYYRPKLVIKSVAIHEGNTAELGMAYPYTALTCEELSDTHYVSKTLRMFKSNATLASISNAVFTAYCNGSGIDDKDSIACGFCPEYTLDGNGVLTNIRVRFCLADSSTATAENQHVKSVVADFQQVDNDIKYIAVSAGYTSGRTTEVTPSTTWTAKTIATKATGNYYGMHDITVLVKTQPEVISVNFAEGDKPAHILSNWTDPGAVIADTDWHNVVGANGTDIGIGSVKLTYTSGGTYRKSDQGKTYNKGYLDDGSNKGNGPEVTFSNLENGTYNVVIYAATDGSNGASDWRYKTVNGVNYYWDKTTGKAAVGVSNWGVNTFSAAAAEPGTHALLVKGVEVTDGTIAITGTPRDAKTAHRGCISAVQIAKRTDVDYTGTISAAEATWSSKEGITSSDTWKNDPLSTITLANNDQAAATLTFDEDVTAASFTLTSAAEKETTLAKTDGATISIAAYYFSGANGKTTFAYDPGVLVTAPHVRYDLALDEKTLDNVIGATGTYEFKSATLNGAGKTTATLKLVEGDEVTLKSGNNDLRSNQNFDVTGGRLYLGAKDNGAIWWGNGSTGNISGGKVIARATGTTQSGSGNGLLFGYGGTGGTINISGTGELNVENSSLNFWASPTLNITGGKVKAKGAFKGSKAGTVNVGEGGMFELGSLGWATGAGTFNLNGGTLKSYEDGATFNDAITLGAASTIQVPADQTLTIKSGVTGAYTLAKTGEGTLATPTLGTVIDFTLNGGAVKLLLTDEQVASTEPFAIFASAQEVSVFEGKVTAVNAAGLAIPGVVGKADGKITFKPSVEFYTLTITDGQSLNWGDNIWTKGGQGGQPYAPAEGKVGDVTITVSGTATLNVTDTPASIGGISFVKAQEAETANITVKYATTTPPTSSAVNVSYSVFGLAPAVGEGVTYAFEPTLDATKYAWECDQAAGTFFATKRPEKGSINIKIGARTDNVTSSITPDLENVGANPLSGLLWTNAKLWNDNNKAYDDFIYVDDEGANAGGKKVQYVFRGPNTYFNGPTKAGGNPCDTGNAILTSSYVDDGSTSAATTWTVTNALDQSDIVTLPAAPNARGWQIHLGNLPYAAFDLYFITASDQAAESLKETPIKLSADGGQNWISYTGDSENEQTKLGTDNWKGLPFGTDELVEAKNYLKMRVSAAIMGVEKLQTLEITHGARNTGSSIRSGLAAIQIVELDNDGVFTLAEDNGNWTTDAIWSSGGVAGKTWVNDGTSYAKIAPSDAITSVTVDAAVDAQQVTLTGDKDFTVNGDYTVTTALGFDLSKYMGALTLNNPTVGELAIGSGKLTVNNEDSEITLNSAASNLVVTAGTLKQGLAECFGADATIEASGSGVLDINGYRPRAIVTLGAGGTLVNNRASLASNVEQCTNIVLTGNATVGGTKDFGLLAHSYEATALELNGYTLTKTGANTFWLCDTTADNGTIDVQEGTINTVKNTSTFPGTINLAAGTMFAAKGTTTVGTITGTGTVTDAITITTKLMGTVHMTATVTFGDGATFDATGCTYTEDQKVLTWTAKPTNLTVIYDGSLALEQRDDGLYAVDMTKRGDHTLNPEGDSTWSSTSFADDNDYRDPSQSANFEDGIAEAATVTISGTRTVGAFVIDNADTTYTVAGGNFVATTFEKKGTGTATLKVGSSTKPGAATITAGTLIVGTDADNNSYKFPADSIVIKDGATLSVRSRDSINGVPTIAVEAGGVLSAQGFTQLNDVTLSGGTIEAAGGWNANYPSWCLGGDNGGKITVTGDGVTSYLRNAAEPINAYIGMQLGTGIFDVQGTATLDVSLVLKNHHDRGQLTDQVRKTGTGTMIVRTTPTYTGITDVQEGTYILECESVAGKSYTIAKDALLKAGKVRGLTVSGAGTVDVILTAAEITNANPIVVFTLESGAVTIGTVKSEAGVTLELGKDYTVEGGTVKPVIPISGDIKALDKGNGEFEITGSGELTDGAALKNRAITNLVIGAGITKIGDGVFSGKASLRDVQIDSGCTTIGSKAFRQCYNLTNVVCSATTVGARAFYNCFSLEKMTFDTKPEFGEKAFSFHTAIYMKGGMPEFYTIPEIVITSGAAQKLLGTNSLKEPIEWTDLTGATPEVKATYHFFKIVVE